MGPRLLHCSIFVNINIVQMRTEETTKKNVAKIKHNDDNNISTQNVRKCCYEM